MASTTTFRDKAVDTAVQAALWGVLGTVVVLGTQAFTWLKYGVWSPGSPLALWAYFDGTPLITQENGKWIVSPGWDLVYKYTIIHDLVGGWVGLTQVLHWCATVHIGFWVLGIVAPVYFLLSDR
jgi:hypothetical protein